MFCCTEARFLRYLVVATCLLCCVKLSLVSGQVVIGLSEMTAIQCGNTLQSPTCVQCPTVQNVSLPANFFTTNIPCTSWPGFYDSSLAYMSQANSAGLSFYFSDLNPPQCTASNYLFSYSIPNQNTCGTSSTRQWFIESPFNSGVEGPPSPVPGSVSNCSWVSPSTNTCPLEFANATYCPGSSYIIAVLGLNFTIYNLCPSTCSQLYNGQCSTTFQQCNATAMAVLANNVALGNQLMCGCAQSLFACQESSGCYSTGAGLGMAYNLAQTYCASGAPLTVNVGCSTSSTTAAPTAAPAAVSVSCTSSDFGGSFGGAIFGTFLMHAITGLAIYAKRRMGPQGVSVSNKQVTAEETGMVSQ